ncbi:RNA polymerase subunit sigma [Caldinitratiruptor microaerophilus]|uniref:RNA polymerase sigma factor n=1 Tax=Caldinitratiruptor microaerophilus TaxID=671077 RepID=A0AA35GAA9_9FIRM|nr:RNA polymerase subunit sigma [Caldinitratiruptor microaerophilus]
MGALLGAGGAVDRDELLTQWMEQYGTRILHLAYFYLKDRHLAEDVAQEVFLRAYRHMDSFRGDSAVYTWLYRIAVNVCRDRARSPWWRRVTLPGQLPLATGGEFPEEAAVQADRRQAVLEHVLALPVHYREVLVLYYYQDLSTGDIARVLDLPENTVKTRLHRARQQLRDALSARGVTA